ncbi:MAG: hypothetical protein PHY47_21710 [Lachnospiraceae bacterium]|nr:hypothetical protein [Lachnospiraceae bacterium]
MTKENVWIFSIAIAFAIGVVVIMKLNGGKFPSGVHKTQSTETVSDVETESMPIAEKVSNNPVLAEDFKKTFETTNALSVEKVVRTITESEDGGTNTKYESYLLSYLDLSNHTEQTMDYSNASVGEDFEVNKVIESDFISEYGFDYNQINGYELYERLLKESGIDGNLNKVTFDAKTYDMTGQEVYVLDQECSVIQKLLKKVDYDEIISSEVSYQITNINGVVMPEYFTAVVQYKAGTQIVTKNLFLQITLESANLGGTYELEE